MKYIVEESLEDFKAWAGGTDTLTELIKNGDCDAVEELIEGSGGEELTDTQINDLLWFERDWIAEYLGYEDWDDYEEKNREEDE